MKACTPISMIRTSACGRRGRAGRRGIVPESRVIHLDGAIDRDDRPAGAARRRLPPTGTRRGAGSSSRTTGPGTRRLADAAFILGFAAWRLRRWIQRKPDTDPPYMLIDSIRHSVFCAGFKVPVVENPALREATMRPREAPGEPQEPIRAEPLAGLRAHPPGILAFIHGDVICQRSPARARHRPPSPGHRPRSPNLRPVACAPHEIDEQGRRWTFPAGRRTSPCTLDYLDDLTLVSPAIKTKGPSANSVPLDEQPRSIAEVR